MIKNIKIQGLIAMLLLSLVSCSKDLGNYNYKEINEVEFGGFQDEYTALLGENLSITPELTFTKGTNDDSRYSYEWIANASFGLPLTQRNELVTTKDLKLEPVTLAPGKYTLILNVTDNETDIVWRKTVPLNVQSSIYEGWLLLNKTATGSRLDMISYIENTFTPIIDVLDFTKSSLKLEGDPVQVVAYNYDPNLFGIYVTTTGNGTTKIDPETFDWHEELRLSYEMLSNVPTDFGADQIARTTTSSSFMQKDGDVFYYFRTFQWRYGTPINTMDGLTFSIAPFIVATPGYSVFYDETNQRFLRQNYNETSMSEMPEGTLFDYNTGKDLVFMEWTSYNGAEIFAMLNEDGSPDLYLARISAPWGSFSQVYYEKIPDAIAVDMKQADHFAVSPDFGYLFYNVGGKVYEYDFSLKTTKLMLDKGSKEITELKFDDFAPRNLDDENYSAKLIVSSTDNTPGGGTFELYTVPPVNGTIQLFESYTGFDRIESSVYRYR